MCLFPSVVVNPKYRKNKKNGGIIPQIPDERVKFVPIGCKECFECRKQKGNEWRVRLSEEIRHDNKGLFVTLTFSNKSIRRLVYKLKKEGFQDLEGYGLDEAIATKGIRLFLDRFRKQNGKSPKHWLVTELGHNGTENVHVHGIIWANKKAIKKAWGEDFIYTGYSLTEKTVNYVVKYIFKQDKKHKYFKSKIYTSAGIGKGYFDRSDWKKNKYNKITDKTVETYVTRTGRKYALPIYYRNKIYSEDEREILWLEKLDKQERWVDGVKVSIADGYDKYDKLLKEAQKKNDRLGYGNGQKEWSIENYERQRRNLMYSRRCAV